MRGICDADALTTLRTSVKESLQIHFKVAVRSFHEAGDSLIMF